MWLATDRDVHLLLGSNLQTVDLAEDLYFMQFQLISQGHWNLAFVVWRVVLFN